MNNKGNTALHEAVKRNFTASVEILVNGGADVTLRNKQDLLAVDLTDVSETHKHLWSYSVACFGFLVDFFNFVLTNV